MALDNVLPLEAVVLVDLAIVLVAGTLVAGVIRRFHQPPVIAEIALGLALGPSLLGLLPGDLPAVLFPESARPVLSVVAQIGLVLFMFHAGWELELGRLRGRGRALTSLAASAMAVPFALGGVAAALLYTDAPHGVGKAEFVLYLATAFSITAFPVLARIIRDSRLSHTRVGVLSMACAALGDVAAWCVLVLVIAVAGAGGAVEFGTTLGLTVAFGLVMATLVRPLLRRLVDRFEAAPTTLLLSVVAPGIFLSSVATTWIGIHAIFGAFAFGLAMPRQLPPRVATNVVAPVEKMTGLLLPVFFVITGLSVDVTVLGGTGVGFLALALAAAVIGKFVGTTLPARLWGMPWREAGAFGALMNTRGLTEIVVLGIGRDMGLIGDQLFTVMVLMALVTTAMAGPLLKILRVQESGTPPAEFPAVAKTPVAQPVAG
ncbi:cation:proton antiporter [Streptomyces sp. NPDC048436]|uniref:cation:proton antiporter domain-containing protein n=1 Tax=Streptomyces sp. NPDC048436 TaxID=3365550 RepID=UPI003722DEA7